MSSSVAFQSTKWTLNLFSKLMRAKVRMHRTEVLTDDMAIIFVVNHFTRLETVLLPYLLHKHSGLTVWSLASKNVFVGRIGDYMRRMGTVSTADPDRDKIIIKSLLTGENPWIIFPEGAMIKDKKVVDAGGRLSVFSNGIRRPPHRGAAALALRAEYYRSRLQNCEKEESVEQLKEALGHFDLRPESIETIKAKRTVIVPVNITYFPIRSGENLLLRLARGITGNLSPRALEELSVEGTVVSSETDIDITFGDPIDLHDYLDAREKPMFFSCSEADFERVESDPRSVFNAAALRLMHRYMSDIYRLTTINYDHILATLLRHQHEPSVTERTYRNRVYLCADRLRQLRAYRPHPDLVNSYEAVLFEDSCPRFEDFIALCKREGVLKRHGNEYERSLNPYAPERDFHQVRMAELTRVIANEIEPLTVVTNMIKDIAALSRSEVSARIGTDFLELDQTIFERDYAEHFDEELSKSPEVGQPFLLVPEYCKGGVVLSHGYMAAPLEVRALAEYLYRSGYAVYGVRLKGHGTAPADLARTDWQAWYASFNRGYAVIKSLTDNVIVGGFSMGGVMALLAAGRKREKVSACFSICAPLELQSYAVRLVPTIVSMNSLLRRMNLDRESFDFVDNVPENAHINYTKNPLRGVRELGHAMSAMESVLPDIVSPTLVLQASGDPTVAPVSGEKIFRSVGTPHKEFIMLARDRHGIVNGEGSEDVFGRVLHFLQWAENQEPVALAEPDTTPVPADKPQSMVHPSPAAESA